MVAWLAERLTQASHSPAVLTRGYRRSSSEEVILYPGDRADAADCGDEALMLLRRFESKGLRIPIAIGADRYQAGCRMLADAERRTVSAPDVLVLDDGFQHLKLDRDLDLVLIDVTNPFGGEATLPLGRLREPLSSLSRAAAFLLTRTEPGRKYGDLEQRLRQWNPHAPVFHSWTRALGVASDAEQVRPLTDLAGQRIVAFCGLGNPESFWRVLRREGLQVVRRIAFPDHHRYTPQNLEQIAQAVDDSNAGLLLTTEKDVMNLYHHAGSTRLALSGMEPPIAHAFEKLHWLPIETVVEQEEELLSWIEHRISGKTLPKAPKTAEAQARAQVRA
jgi:tetraacyldisaccharide 4'-kinase